MSSIRVMIFTDGSNVHWGIKDYNKENKTNPKTDHAKLTSLLLKSRTLVRVIYHCSNPPGRSIRSQLYSVHYSRGKSAHYTTVGPIVSTIALWPTATKKSRLSYFLMAL